MRNPPERYLQTLRDHFAQTPSWFGSAALVETDFSVDQAGAVWIVNNWGIARSYQAKQHGSLKIKFCLTTSALAIFRCPAAASGAPARIRKDSAACRRRRHPHGTFRREDVQRPAATLTHPTGWLRLGDASCAHVGACSPR